MGCAVPGKEIVFIPAVEAVTGFFWWEMKGMSFSVI